jgi:type IV pilus assembly protein PilE
VVRKAKNVLKLTFLKKGGIMKRGFTLIELIIVIIIIGVLATLAVPQYLKSTERAKVAKAKHAMGIIAQAEKMFRAQNDTYVDIGADAADAALGAFTELADIDADPDWAYTTENISTNTFTVRATRENGSMATNSITLNEGGVWDETGFVL